MTDSLEPPQGAAGNGKTVQSYIAGIGASGALLAGAVVTFVFLVGTVSFEVWPAASNSDDGTDSLGVAELGGGGGGGGGGEGSAGPSLGATVALIADSVPSPAVARDPAPKADGGLNGIGGSDQGSGGSDDGAGGTGDGSDGSGTAGDDPGGDDPGGGGGGGGGSGDNGPSDRPSSSNPRPSGGTGSTGTAAIPAPPAGNEGSDRPSAGDRGRG